MYSIVYKEVPVCKKFFIFNIYEYRYCVIKTVTKEELIPGIPSFYSYTDSVREVAEVTLLKHFKEESQALSFLSILCKYPSSV